MRFYDIVYRKYGSIREYLKKKFLKETEEKLEEALELYAITKGIICGRINPTTTQLEEKEVKEEILYICMQCATKENIPKEVVEYFDEMAQTNIDEPPCFSCEKCGGVMRPQEYQGVYGKTYRS